MLNGRVSNIRENPTGKGGSSRVRKHTGGGQGLGRSTSLRDIVNLERRGG